MAELGFGYARCRLVGQVANLRRVGNPPADACKTGVRSRFLCRRGDRRVRPITAISQLLSPIFPMAYTRRISARRSCRDEHGLDDESFSSCSRRASAQNYETNPSPPIRCARGGPMSHCPFARDGLPLNPCQNYETNPRPSILVCFIRAAAPQMLYAGFSARGASSRGKGFAHPLDFSKVTNLLSA
jgi:hypothetical protein